MPNLKNLTPEELKVLTTYMISMFWELSAKTATKLVFNTYNDRPSKSKDPEKQAENDVVNVYTVDIETAKNSLSDYIRLEMKDSEIILRFYPRKSDFEPSAIQTTKTEMSRIAENMGVSRGEAFEAIISKKFGCIECVEDWTSADKPFYNDDRIFTKNGEILIVRGFKSTLCNITTIIKAIDWKYPQDIAEILKNCEYCE